MSETFVLIHGTWHGGWAWQGVIRHLEAKGHHAYAPTLIGHSPADERVGITHRDCVDSVVSYIRRHDLQDVILVGHSFGGTVISKAAEYLPNRIKRLIFANALVLEDGQSVYDNLPSLFWEHSSWLRWMAAMKRTSHALPNLQRSFSRQVQSSLEK